MRFGGPAAVLTFCFFGQAHADMLDGTPQTPMGLTTRPSLVFKGNAQFNKTPTTNSLTGTPTAIRAPMSSITTVYVNPAAGTAVCGVTGALICGPGSASPIDPTNPTTPFNSSQAAIGFISKSVDAQSFVPTINLAHGTSSAYSFQCTSQPLLGQVTFQVVGDYSAPSAVNLVAPNGSYGIFVKDQCVPSLSSFTITDQGASLGGIYSGQQGIVDQRSMRWGSWNSGAAMTVAIDGGKINWLGQDPLGIITNTLVGTTYGQVIQAQYGGIQDLNSQLIDIPNNITIAGGTACGGSPCSFVFASGAYIKGLGGFSGTGSTGSTGLKCTWANSYSGGTNPNSIFPGNSTCAPVNNTF